MAITMEGASWVAQNVDAAAQRPAPSASMKSTLRAAGESGVRAVLTTCAFYNKAEAERQRKQSMTFIAYNRNYHGVYLSCRLNRGRIGQHRQSRGFPWPFSVTRTTAKTVSAPFWWKRRITRAVGDRPALQLGKERTGGQRGLLGKPWWVGVCSDKAITQAVARQPAWNFKPGRLRD